MNGQRTQLSFPPFTPAVRLIVFVTAGAYILEILWAHWIAGYIFPDLEEMGIVGANIATRRLHLAIDPAEFVSGYIWQPLTYMLLHDPLGPMHVALNLVFTWLFGAEFEQRWGFRRFLWFYVLSGALAGLFVIFWGALIPSEWDKVTLGSSGAVYALIAAYAVAFPNRQLWPIPIRVKTFVWILVVLTVLYFLVRSDASFAAHMGGLGAGWLLTTGNWRPRRWVDRWQLWRLKRRRKTLTVIDGEKRKPNGRVLH